ncbi:O-succinylhomoserine sulfhydrylase [Spiribacter salinus M19-40]|jgi:O-succinylhomoserine sulfhydrylase|uniref:O-succinylhomoserine sulfhydrylase n=2 Tax=Spiribacter salinus TaxID=1335746 RepID=R4VPE7_9GAMM|nr:O-succinylhomoserine sulfhydrylase [Spiribacter salinus]AGM41378.1 O-succinylhomoserine sulfhydrylase [Spiribacter salinus M19-40]MBY5268968.1 O-succinylhomoserine sulfhydrylase [Spiribacter salinus]TQF00731.1 MAG: O-succinylhomoserine sulfhydrylase [Spiribacter salinus]
MSWGADTTGLRGGWERTGEQEHSEAIFPTSSFSFASAAEAAARFSGDEPGNIYSRFTNPTVRAFENRLAAMEGGERAIGMASGMAAILATCLSLLRMGDHVICSLGVFGTTASLFANQLSRFGITTDFVSPTDPAAWAAAVRPETRMLFLETPSNPLTEVADIQALADLAHENDAWLVVDNCFCTPALQRPLDFGADLVTHSATKYLDGQGRCVGGAVVGDAKTLDEQIFPFLRTAGPSMSPFNAWVFLKGLETLGVRMRAHSEQAQALAHWLVDHPQVERVFYTGLPDHPQRDLAARQQKAFGGVVSFEVAGGREAAWRVVDATQMLSITANLGDVRTTITHPASTTHGRVPAEQRLAMGIHEGLVRISVGLEDLEDIQADLDRGLSGSA